MRQDSASPSDQSKHCKDARDDQEIAEEEQVGGELGAERVMSRGGGVVGIGRQQDADDHERPGEQEANGAHEAPKMAEVDELKLRCHRPKLVITAGPVVGAAIDILDRVLNLWFDPEGVMGSEASATRVIVVTTFGVDEDVPDAMLTGVSGFLPEEALASN